jgi:hypothetical protein
MVLMLVKPSHSRRKQFNLDQIPILQVRKLRPRMVKRPALQSVRCQCKITTLLYSNVLKKTLLPFCSILRTLSENIPQWTQSRR